MRRRSILASAVLFVIVLGSFVFTQKVKGLPLPIGDAGYTQANPFDTNPKAGSTSNAGTVSGMIGNSFDGYLATSIAWKYGNPASPDIGYVEANNFKLPSDYGREDFAVSFVDFKVSYKAAGGSATDEVYRIVLYVNPSPDPVVLQDWVSGVNAKYDQGSSKQGHRAFSNVSEPNDGVWTWSDVAASKLQIEFKRGSSNFNHFQTFTLYEVWASVYATLFPEPSTISVQPSVITNQHPGDVFFVDVYVTNVTNLWGYQFILIFNSSVLTAMEYFSYGPFVNPLFSKIGPGFIIILYMTYPGDPIGFTGNTPVLRIYFQVVAEGYSWLSLTSTEATDFRGNIIALAPRNAIFSSTPAPRVLRASADVKPDSLNFRSRGLWITAYIQLPQEYNAADINATTILLNGTMSPVLNTKYGFVTNSSEYLVDHDGDGILERMIKFDMSAMKSFIYDQGGRYGYFALTIGGKLFDGTLFEGTDVVFVNFCGDVNNDGIIDVLDAAVVSAHWYPGPPVGPSGFDSTADLNNDGVVNIIDAGLISLNWGETVP